MKVPAHLQPGLREMLNDLRTQCLQVVCIPAPECKHGSQRVRKVVSQNPEWYQTFCASHIKVRSNNRKRRGHHLPDTRINRKDVICRLTTALKTGEMRSKYAEELLGFAQEIVDEIDKINETAAEELITSGCTNSGDVPF